jgi:hypothetical protein
VKRVAVLRGVGALALALAAVACSKTSNGPAAFPAAYVPGGTINAPAVPGCATFATVTFADARQDPTVVGERFMEDEPGRWPISMQGDPVPMLQQAAERTMRAGAMVANPGAPNDLRISLVSILMEEKQSWNSMYKAALVLETTVLNHGTGTVVWSSRHTGQGSNYGGAGEAVNYQETVSRALNEAIAAALSDPALHQALCQQPSAAPAPAEGAAPAPAASATQPATPPAASTTPAPGAAPAPAANQ